MSVQVEETKTKVYTNNNSVKNKLKEVLKVSLFTCHTSPCTLHTGIL